MAVILSERAPNALQFGGGESKDLRLSLSSLIDKVCAPTVSLLKPGKEPNSTLHFLKQSIHSHAATRKNSHRPRRRILPSLPPSLEE